VIGKAVNEMKDQAPAERQPRTVVPLTRRPQGVAIGRRSPAVFGWPALIVILLVGCGIFAVTDSFASEATWRTVTDGLIVGLIFAAMGAWVRANRPALAQLGESASEKLPLEIRYVASLRTPPWRAELRERGIERGRPTGARRISTGRRRS
jgi:hypothetical protein